MAEALVILLARSAPWDETDVEKILDRQLSIAVPVLAPLTINLSQYDQLLEEGYDEPA